MRGVYYVERHSAVMLTGMSEPDVRHTPAYQYKEGRPECAQHGAGKKAAAVCGNAYGNDEVPYRW